MPTCWPWPLVIDVISSSGGRPVYEDTFEGVVSGMLERGIFVEIKHMLTEGMVDFSRCPEPFEVQPSRLQAKGVRSGKVLRMGQTVTVQIADADLASRQIDMKLVAY